MPIAGGRVGRWRALAALAAPAAPIARATLPLAALLPLGLVSCGPGCGARTIVDDLPDSVEVVARGNGPFWGVTISHAGIVFREPENLDGLAFPYSRPRIEGGRRVFRSTRPDSTARSIEVAIEEKPCGDGMSDESYRFTAAARLGDRELKGCALERPAGAGGIDRRWLLDGAYLLEYASDRAVRLTHGAYDSSDSLGPVRVRLGKTAAGDLDGDRKRDAAVVLATNTGGSGTFMSVVAVLNRWGRAEPAGEVVLGDRTPVDSLYIADREIVVHFTDHGPRDPMCCPTVKTTRRLRVEDGRLVGR